MAILVFQHVEHETTAALGRVLQGDGHRLRTIKLYDGDCMPPDLDDVDGVVSMGGPMNVDQDDQYPWIRDELDYLAKAHTAGTPIVGICLGAQLVATALGGEVAAMPKPEVGWQPLRLSFPGTVETLYNGIPWTSVQFHLHGQEITKAPPGATPLAGSTQCRIQAFKLGLRTYGFQYHFEWDQEQIVRFASDDMVQQLDTSARAIIDQISEYYDSYDQISEYYDSYRRLGDRLSQSIAAYLFPIEKRVAS